ncbi:adenylate/guanylate cyclase domain-containing protein [Acuticoccus kandeliae]|uniref:adenylate/guanylate cyclase domain-containing protein n=1 Tax=Acuticoccus kandeliae TaxID=2073160 RepID=UPI001475A98B|nr:adenylate/guanylate cyclase domain-containing protein [Acuticoccus kandeliae]
MKLRDKLLAFAIVIAVVPLLTAGQSLIRIARDELKSSANAELLATVRQVAQEIDGVYTQVWLAPLRVIRNAIDDQELGVREKIALLQEGISELPDLVALQITVKEAALPLLITQNTFNERLARASLVPKAVLTAPGDPFQSVSRSDIWGAPARLSRVDHIAETDDWLATIALPLLNGVSGQEAVLTARFNLTRLRKAVEGHSINATGRIFIVDSEGQSVLTTRSRDLRENPVVAQAMELLRSQTRVASVGPFTLPGGEQVLAAYAFPQPFGWAVIADKSETIAYFAVRQMIQSLGWWLALGLLAAGGGAYLVASRMSRPVVAMAKTVNAVGDGDFTARVEGTGTHSRDEIGDLARHINEMIVQISERFQLAKFVSGGTLEAIQRSDQGGVRLGGERRQAAILFSDIRGYTAFAESRDPSVVVDVLNLFFRNQTDIVLRHGGDVDKFVGDQIMAVFLREEMAADAVACALEIQDDMQRVIDEHPDLDLKVGIGVDVGDVVMGAMGSRTRMDFTVLGDRVNIAARLCSAAPPGETFVSTDAATAAARRPGFRFTPMEPLHLKGKGLPVAVFKAELDPASDPAPEIGTARPMISDPSPG